MRLRQTFTNARISRTLSTATLLGCLGVFGCALNASDEPEPAEPRDKGEQTAADVLSAEAEQSEEADVSVDDAGAQEPASPVAVDAVVKDPSVGQTVAWIGVVNDPPADDPPADDPPADDPPADIPVEDTLCQMPNGEPRSADLTRGVIDTFAFEVSLSCDLGGHMAVLEEQDPVGLSAVAAFNGKLADWYRAHILMCPDVNSTWSGEQFGLLPPNDNGFSQGDVLTAVTVFLTVLGYFDGAPEGATEEQKAIIEARLTDIGQAAAVSESLDPTMPLDTSACTP